MSLTYDRFLLPDKFIWDKDTLRNDYGKCILEPLDRGFGVTIGNSLRRILLSSIPGAAVTAVKIDGVLHEFSTIPGVYEDVIEIITNLKQLVLKLRTDTSQTLRLDFEGEGKVTARNFQINSNVEILNPDLHIATLAEDGSLHMEVTVSSGRGYVPAEVIKRPNQPIGLIPVDAIFSPVTQVKYEVENTRVGKITDYERLILELWTKGNITPVEAVKEAAQILTQHLSVILSSIEKDLESVPEELTSKAIDASEIDEKILEKSIEELDISLRAFNCLKNAGLKTIRDIISKTEEEILDIPSFGAKSLSDLKAALKKVDPRLKLKKSES